MWNCFINKIWILYLLAYSSHVLQPLDVAIFSPLKRLFRKTLAKLMIDFNSFELGKPGMLEAYEVARKERLVLKNILIGWKATGIFPRDRLVPLNNSMVVVEPTTQTIPQTPQLSNQEPKSTQTAITN